jgi:hypothetical protein
MTVRRLFQVAGWLCVATIVVLSLVAPSLGRVTFAPRHLEYTAIFAAAASRSASVIRGGPHITWS